jgi:hypothetical protein
MMILMLILLLIVASPVFAEEARPVAGLSNFQSQTIKHSWASKRFDHAILGVAAGDVNADGVQDIILLQQNAVCWFNIEDGALNPKSRYEWKGLLQGIRLYLMNLDDDPSEEIVVSAVDQGRPSSFALKWSEGGFKMLFEKIPWHLRVLSLPPQDGAGEISPANMRKIIVGQQWNSSSFFAGPVYELSFDGKKLKRAARVRLPGGMSIFNFAVLSLEDAGAGNPAHDSQFTIRELVGLEGYEPIKVYERRKKRYKKIWSSGGRFGGTMNLVEAAEREPLGIANVEDVPIDREPDVVFVNNVPMIMALKHDIPLKNIIGRNPYIRSGHLAAFRSDPSLVFAKVFETEEIPGFISDFAMYDGSKKIILSIEPDTSAFYETREGLLVIYDIPQ